MGRGDSFEAFSKARYRVNGAREQIVVALSPSDGEGARVRGISACMVTVSRGRRRRGADNERQSSKGFDEIFGGVSAETTGCAEGLLGGKISRGSGGGPN